MSSVKMDDLDHSMNMSDFLWRSFYDQSEECDLLQPALAHHDHLSDSEESFFSSSSSLQEALQDAEVDCDVTERDGAQVTPGNVVGSKEERSKNSEDEIEDIIEDKDVTEDVTGDRSDNMDTLGHVACSHDDVLKHELKDPQARVHVPAEKERWFVTMDYNPVRAPPSGSAGRKKRRPKKPYRKDEGPEGERESKDKPGPSTLEDTVSAESAELSSNHSHETAESAELSSNHSHDSERYLTAESAEETSGDDAEDYTIDRPIDHAIDHAIDHIVDHAEDHTVDRPVDHTVDHAEDHAVDHAVDHAIDHAIDHIVDHAEDHTVDHTVDHAEDHAVGCAEDHTIDRPVDHTVDHAVDHAEDHAVGRAEDHTIDRPVDHTVDHAVDHAVDHTVDHTVDHAEDHTVGRAEDHTVDHAVDHAEDHTVDRPVDHTVDHAEDHTVGCAEDHTIDHAVDHAEVHTVDHSVDHAEDHTVDHPVDHIVDHALDHAADHIVDHAEDHTEDHAVDHIVDHTEDHTVDHAEDHAPQVFVISAFWHEMEKLTINDILQLRTRRRRESNTVHSDDFTQTDESRPEREEEEEEEEEEEYWQSGGSRRNYTPDPHDSQSQERSDSYEEDIEDIEDIEDKESWSSAGTPTLRPSNTKLMRKSKSMHHVPDLNKDTELVPFAGFQSTRDRTTVLKDQKSLETCGLVLYDNDVLDQPDVLEYFFTEDEIITVYNPSLCPLRDDVPPPSFLLDRLCTDHKPVPIFSCCPSTFPKTDFVFLRTEDEVDDFSPIRVVSRSLVQADPSGSHSWKTFFNMRKTGFHGRGRTFLDDSGKTEGKVLVFPQLQPSILGTKRTESKSEKSTTSSGIKGKLSSLSFRTPGNLVHPEAVGHVFGLHRLLLLGPDVFRPRERRRLEGSSAGKRERAVGDPVSATLREDEASSSRRALTFLFQRVHRHVSASL